MNAVAPAAGLLSAQPRATIMEHILRDCPTMCLSAENEVSSLEISIAALHPIGKVVACTKHFATSRASITYQKHREVKNYF